MTQVKELARVAEGQGWRVERTRGSHWKFLPPDVTKPAVVFAGTPSDHRGFKNGCAALKRSGLDLAA